MIRLTARNLWAHKARFVMTGLAVILGVAFMSGTMVLTDTMGRTFDDLFTSVGAGADVVVQRPSNGGTTRERVPATVVEQVRRVDGVGAVAGTVLGLAQIVLPDGTVARTQGLAATVGTNWVSDERLSSFTLTSGTAPRGPTDVVLDQGTAERQGRRLGDPVTVVSQAGTRTLTLVGTAGFGALGELPNASLVATGDATAQELFGQPGAWDAVTVAAAPGVDPPVLAGRITTAVVGGGPPYEVRTGQDDTAAKQAQFKEDLSFFNTFLLSFAYLSLFVAVFIIYNTFSIVVAQRSRDLALLRALGARRRQVLGSIVLESLVVGLLAAGVGLVGGIGMSHGLRALLDGLGLTMPAGPIVLSPRTIAASAAVGVVVTVVSAVAPALRASRIAPIAALRSTASEAAAVSWARVAAGAGIALAGAVAFGAGVSGADTGAMPQIGIGMAVTMLGVLVLSPALARPVVRLVGAPAALLWGTAGRLARENAVRSPKRTAATASALMIGVALVSFITLLAASTKASVSNAVDRSFKADYVIATTDGAAELSPRAAAELARLPEVAAVGPLRRSGITVDGREARVAGAETSTLDGLYDLDTSSGRVADVGGDGVGVLRSEADNRHVAVGDTVTLTFPRTGPVPLRVRAVFDANLPTDALWLVDLSTYEANVTDQVDHQIFVKAAPGASPEASRRAIDGVLEAFPQAEVQDQTAFKTKVTTQIDQILNLIYGLLALAVIIALIGIANTLALSVHERTRELGLLRAVGMTRRQVRTAVRWEAVLIALLGTTAGLVLATVAAWGMVQALASASSPTFVVPAGQLAVIVTLAVVAAVVAATGPARKAARLDILRAIAQS